jgi:hypothetical protein
MKIRSDLAQATVKLSKALPAGLLLFLLPGQIPLFGQANVETIIQRSIEALKRDWATDPQFDYTERDQEKGGSKINEVTMLFGSPYQRLITVNGRPLSASEKAEEQKKFEEAVKERRNETPEKRSERIAKFEAERKRDHTMMEQLTTAFDFRLLGNHKLKGHRVCVLGAKPRKDYHPPNRDSQVLTGMEGKLWIDRDSYQWVRVEAYVMHPVRIEGIVAEVEPGTEFELEKMPVSNDVWLTAHFSMRSYAKVMFFFLTGRKKILLTPTITNRQDRHSKEPASAFSSDCIRSSQRHVEGDPCVGSEKTQPREGRPKGTTRRNDFRHC